MGWPVDGQTTTNNSVDLESRVRNQIADLVQNTEQKFSQHRQAVIAHAKKLSDELEKQLEDEAQEMHKQSGGNSA
ncbi:Small hydrophilic protein [Caenorhabditis elegans]|uniref:Small hydrophilic protein n=1 Tax=Caenorhabditis elegans TaxID=6239 RepID=Q564U6_CAEEL|nr:Small hydrophilic protein [Caenorhabditis elegans]CAI79125.1 Small hydrophilic protein [Caenorhabditis elegans]|eukprot:NP_001023778.1 Uncharacterized protein CELE_F09C6.14 [Caenorhabditis elegans]